MFNYYNIDNYKEENCWGVYKKMAIKTIINTAKREPDLRLEASLEDPDFCCLPPSSSSS